MADQQTCEVCGTDYCRREELHATSPLAVLLDRMSWPHTHGRIELSWSTRGGFTATLDSSRGVPRVAYDDSYGFRGASRSEALRKAVAKSLGEEPPEDDLTCDPLAVRLDALPAYDPWGRIVLRRDQLHIYCHIGKQFGGHGLASALDNMIRLSYEQEKVT